MNATLCCMNYWFTEFLYENSELNAIINMKHMKSNVTSQPPSCLKLKKPNIFFFNSLFITTILNTYTTN